MCNTMMPTTARSLRPGAGRARRQPRGPGVRRQGPARVQLWRGLRAGVLLHGRWLLCAGRRRDALPQGLHRRHRAGVKPVPGAVGAGGSGRSGQRTQQPCSVRGQRVARGCPSTPPSARSPVHSTVHPPPIEQGGLVVLGRPFISDAISGPGYLRVLYLDEEIRCRLGGDSVETRWRLGGG